MFNVQHTLCFLLEIVQPGEEKMRCCVASVIDQASVFITLGNR